MTQPLVFYPFKIFIRVVAQLSWKCFAVRILFFTKFVSERRKVSVPIRNVQISNNDASRICDTRVDTWKRLLLKITRRFSNTVRSKATDRGAHSPQCHNALSRNAAAKASLLHPPTSTGSTLLRTAAAAAARWYRPTTVSYRHLDLPYQPVSSNHAACTSALLYGGTSEYVADFKLPSVTNCVLYRPNEYEINSRQCNAENKKHSVAAHALGSSYNTQASIRIQVEQHTRPSL